MQLKTCTHPSSGLIHPFLNRPGDRCDYHLTALSPYRNKGTSSGAPLTDLDGVKRHQGSDYDMGAYEYVGGESAIPAINLLLLN